MRRLGVLGSVIAVLTLGCHAAADDSVLARYSFDEASLVQWTLPKRLREISGLALDTAGRLFAHEDEHAIVYQIDYQDGHLVKAFALGDPTLHGDFEGIAVAGATFYLLASDGTLYRAPEGDDGAHVEYQRIETALAPYCEFEGLTYDAASADLLLACKRSYRHVDADRRWVFRYSTRSQRIVSPAIAIGVRQVAARLHSKSFEPSGIDVVDGHLVLVAARQRALVETEADGELVAALELPLKKRHHQPEGIAITADGRMIISDEGGNGRGRLGVYAPRD
jgi:uncharacterized protein YjiK